MKIAPESRRLSWAPVLMCFGLAACSQPEPPPPAAEPAATATVETERVALPAVDAAELARRADAALREQRLFAPTGDNAFEWLLAAVAADPANPISRAALADLVPYAVLHVEQRTAAGDAEEAGRTLALIEAADAQAPALPRLRAGLESLLASQAQAAARLAAPPPPAATLAPALAAPMAAAPPPPPATQPAVASTAPDTVPTPPPPVQDPPALVPAPVPQPSNAAAPPARSAASPAPSMPEVVFRPALRYPSLAERRRIEGEVELEFTINADGSVGEVRVLRAQPEGIFDREAIGAMERWRFAPPGQPMRARRVLEFKLAR